MNLFAYDCVSEVNVCYKVQGEASQSGNDGIPSSQFLCPTWDLKQSLEGAGEAQVCSWSMSSLGC